MFHRNPQTCRQASTTQSTPASPAKRADARCRGSVIIVVVVAIVLMTVIGAVFIQVAQVQRAVAAQPIDNIDTILASVVVEIKTQLKDDLFDPTGVQFGTGVETYDHPSASTAAWTGTATWPLNGGTAGTGTDPVDGNTNTALRGNSNDDIWLASTNLTHPSGTATWAKVTRLTPRYFIVSGAGSDPSDLTTGTVTKRWYNATNYGTANNADINLTNLTALVDSDGNGVGDSRYERAPIALMSGVEYFMAVRIIDASSLLNIAAATANTADGFTTNTTENAGYWPTSLDMSRLAYKRTTTAPSQFNTVFGAGGLRDTDTGTAGAQGAGTAYATALGLGDATNSYVGSYPTTSVNGQARAWTDGVAQPGDLTGADYGIAALTLAYRGGFYSHPTVTTQWRTEITGNFLAPLDSDAPTNAATWNPDPDTATTPWPHTRHMVTTVSGHGNFSPNRRGLAGLQLKEDLVYRQTGLDGNAVNLQNRANRFNTRLASVLTGYAGSGGTPSLTGAQTAAAFAAQMGEYSDADNTISAGVSDGTDTWYGLEVMPFLVEAYIQVAYEDPDGNLGTVQDWTPKADGHGIVVEIANPFDRPVTTDSDASDATLPNIRLAVIRMDTGAVVSSATLPDATTISPRDATGVNGNQHRLALWSDGSAAATEDAAGTDLDAHIIDGPSAAALTYTTVALADDLLSGIPTAVDIGVAMQVEYPKGSGTWVTYDRLFAGAGSLSFPATIDFSNAAGGAVAPAIKTEAYIQASLKRDDTGINFLANTGKAVSDRGPTSTTAPIATNWPEEVGGYDNDLDGFGKANGITGTDLSAFQLPVANRPFFSVAELGWVHMFGFNSSLTGDFPQLFSGADGTTGVAAAGRFLRFSGTSATGAAASYDASVTYAEAVLEAFTTLDPGYDGVDNNGDGTIDEAGEQLVFGTINLNTAPEHIATLAASYPGTIAQTQSMVQALQTTLPLTSASDMVGRANTIAAATAPASTGAAFDLYPLAESTLAPAAGGQSAVKYAITGDAEQAMKRAQFFLQNFTNRSDIYIAHIFVAGFTDADGDGQYNDDGTGPVESGRMIVVFSRAEMTGSADEVEVLATYRY